MINFAKLDVLHELARDHANDPKKSYMIELLADHTEDDHFDQMFLEWLIALLR